MILGTAGHIDHGKTSLIRALTGVDTDRLPEERRRGITIELGFAPLPIAGLGTIGVVDVPGHEAFVRTMLAGATGVDLALLVVAADEGIMPQTREHVAILTLLGVRAGVVALTKRDLVDEEWAELVTEDVRALLDGGPMEGAPIVGTSVVTGVGLGELRAAIADAARRIPERDGSDLFRMPVDRAFSVRGTGTVATGTVWSGRVARDATLRILPGGRTARVRGVQSHGASLESAAAGQRAAIALAGVDVEAVPRGALLVSDESWSETRALRADVALLDSASQPLRPRTRVRFHLGTLDVGARLVSVGGPIAPGERKPVRVVLDHPVVARAGDRFVLRSASPAATIGGGVVTDPTPPFRRVRPWPADAGNPASRLALLLAEAAGQGVERSTLSVRLGLSPDEAVALLSEASGEGTVAIGARLYDGGVVASLGARLTTVVGAQHETAPLESGMSLQRLRSHLTGAPELLDEVVRRSAAAGAIELDGGVVRARGWAPRMSAEEGGLRTRLAEQIREHGREPPSVGELVVAHGALVPPLLRLLERSGEVVAVEGDRYYAREVVVGLIDQLRQASRDGVEYSPAELRDLLGVSRKYLIPFLEFCDRTGVTRRRERGRVVLGARGESGGGT